MPDSRALCLRMIFIEDKRLLLPIAKTASKVELSSIASYGTQLVLGRWFEV